MGLTLRNAMCVERKPDPSIVIPPSFDWRQHKPACVLPVRDQLQCGACWAFATVLPLSYRACAFGAASAVHSPQYLLNCDRSCFSNAPTICEGGCSGGYLDLAWEFLRTRGTTLESCWPYTQDDNPNACPVDTCPIALQAVDRYTVRTVANIQREILEYGPVTAGLIAYTDLLTYTDGVYIRQSNDVVGGHAITLLGWGTEAGGVPYWLAQNQWGTGWGMQGYIKIRRGTNEAAIEQYIHAGRPNVTGVTFPTADLVAEQDVSSAFKVSFTVWATMVLLLLAAE